MVCQMRVPVLGNRQPAQQYRQGRDRAESIAHDLRVLWDELGRTCPAKEIGGSSNPRYNVLDSRPP